MSLNSVGAGSINIFPTPSISNPIAALSDAPAKEIVTAKQDKFMTSPGQASGLSLPDEGAPQPQEDPDKVAGYMGGRGRRG